MTNLNLNDCAEVDGDFLRCARCGEWSEATPSWACDSAGRPVCLDCEEQGDGVYLVELAVGHAHPTFLKAGLEAISRKEICTWKCQIFGRDLGGSTLWARAFVDSHAAAGFIEGLAAGLEHGICAPCGERLGEEHGKMHSKCMEELQRLFEEE